MKRLLFLAAAGLLLAAGYLTSCERHPRPNPVEAARTRFRQDLDTLRRLVQTELLPLAQRGTRTDSLQAAFVRCRAAYKRIEPFAEYFMPTTSRLVNGPPLDEIELEENTAFEPGGFQVIEEFIYPEFDTSQRAELVRFVRKLNRELNRYAMLWEAFDFTEAHVFDALRLQVFRLESLGLSGFDTPACRTALPEAAVTLATVEGYLDVFENRESVPAYAALRQALTGARAQLKRGTSFEVFDRMDFLVRYANPITGGLLDVQRGLGIAPFGEVRALRADARTWFEPNAFNPDFYAPDADSRMTPAKVRLGKRLFHDPLLSKSGTRSCASCHQPDRAFTDGLAKSPDLHDGFTDRNAPTLLNAVFQNGQFYDLRARNLEGQSRDVVENRDEMHGSVEETARRLQADAEYRKEFATAFRLTGPIQPAHVLNALASYERSLTSFNSPFDRYLRGERTALNDAEIRGFNLFMGKAQCGICHFMPLFNGTVPPGFTKTELEVIGTPATPANDRLDADQGRYAINQLPQLRHAFKTPTVRNVALTAPYMHNGVYRTLEEVVEFYDRGGGTGLGFDLPNQTLPGDRLNLTKREKSELVQFLKALTDASVAEIPKPIRPAVAQAARR
jgi:cytochrome c peroxidase